MLHVQYVQATLNSGFPNWTNFALIRALQKLRFVQFVRVVKNAKIDGEYIKMHLIVAPLQQATRMQIMIKYFNAF